MKKFNKETIQAISDINNDIDTTTQFFDEFEVTI